MSISIKDVVAITGTPGLHKIIKADDKAIIVESIDEKQKRPMVRGNMLASKIMDVSIYTTEDSEPLVNVLKSIQEKFGGELPVTKKSSKNELVNFLREVLPNFDEERVYPSNIKKLVSWYEIIHTYDIDLNTDKEDDTPLEDSEAGNEKPESDLEKNPKADEDNSIKKDETIKASTDQKKTDEPKAPEPKQKKTEEKPEKRTKSKEKSESSPKEDKAKTNTTKKKEKQDKETEKTQKKSSTNSNSSNKKSTGKAPKNKDNPGKTK